MSVNSQSSQCQSLIPMFMGTRDRNVTFLLDSSEAMGSVLGSVKHLLVQALLTKASLRDSLFNIISFSYKVAPWQGHMIPCAPDTVYEALGWIHALSASPGRDLLSALGMAFADPLCHAVHLVTNGPPDDPERCLGALSALGPPHPVRVFLLADQGRLDAQTLDFLQCLTCATGGSCHTLSLGSDGAVEQVRLLYAADGQTTMPHCSAERRCCGLGTALNNVSSFSPELTVSLSPYRCLMGNPFSPISPCVSGMVTGSSEFFPGCRVLARRDADGLYYLGTIKQELQGRSGMFMVEFDRPDPEGDPGVTSARQLACLPDMLNHTRTHGRSLAPGDTVLAPWEPGQRRYGPGRVVAGVELREPLRVGVGSGLQVAFWNGKETQVAGDLAVWIPASRYEQIIRELQRPLSFAPCCRSYQHCGLPTAWPRRLCCTHYRQPSAPLCRCPIEQWRPVTAPPSLVQGRGQREGLDWKVGLQLEALQGTREAKAPSPLSSSSSSLSEDEEGDADGKRKSTGSGLVSQSVNTELSLLRKVLRPEPESSRPSWRYWRRCTPEPQHRQPENVVKRHSRPAIMSHPVHDLSNPTITNHSSLFEQVPGSAGRRLTVREIFGLAESRPSPKRGFQFIIAGEHVPTAPT